ncbi:MAG TPA: enoyl-CoA hydratase/isomerase family protein, partial [Tepidiformaceae bacterium]
MSDVLLEKRPDGVALITLNRPDSLNAMGGRLVPMIGDYLAQCEEDREVRCIALTGAGRAFCAGGDVKDMGSRNTTTSGTAGDGNLVTTLDARVRELRHSHNRTSFKLHTIGKPTVALVNGHAVGAGLSLALACDIRIASDR